MNDSNDIFAHQCVAFHTIAIKGDIDYGRDKLDLLFMCVEKNEPNNANLYY